MTAIGILGSEGRMGRAIAAVATDLGASVAGGVDAGGDPLSLARGCDVLVDFTAPSALEANLAAACEGGTPIVVGTTGLTAQHHAMIDNAAARIAVLQTSTTSLGITLLARLVADAAEKLGPDWDIEIVEAHHRHKVDAPSGTALKLGAVIASALQRKIDAVEKHGRHGDTGERPPREIGFHAIRGGDIVGEHTALFAGLGERLELTVRSQSRMTYAAGAVRAAKWLRGRPAGVYDMFDVLGLR
jgi:4-hydroxy-tetrahydrodipicolinate reductase